MGLIGNFHPTAGAPMANDQRLYEKTEESAEGCIDERWPDPTRAPREMLWLYSRCSPLAPIRPAMDSAGGITSGVTGQSVAMSKHEYAQAIRARGERRQMMMAVTGWQLVRRRVGSNI